ncbi:amine oxidase [Peptoniphilus lacrimalis DNF00528]|nr:amine oxidase [Peptoniphilus lacrimalis DNF00528]
MKLRKVITLTAISAMLISPVSAFAENPASTLKDTIKATEQEFKKDTKEAKEDIKEAKKDLKEETKEVKKDLKEEAKEAKKDLKEEAKEAKKDLKEEAKEAKKDAKETVKVTVNGKELELENPAIIKANRTFIPVRKLVESSGAKIEWNAKDKAFTITKGEKVMTLTIGSTDMVVDGKAQKLEAAPFIADNFSYLPLRVICEEILGYKVEWKAETKEVILTSQESKKEEVKEKIEKKAEEVKEDAKELKDKVAEKAGEAKEKVEEKVNENKAK